MKLRIASRNATSSSGSSSTLISRCLLAPLPAQAGYAEKGWVTSGRGTANLWKTAGEGEGRGARRPDRRPRPAGRRSAALPHLAAGLEDGGGAGEGADVEDDVAVDGEHVGDRSGAEGAAVGVAEQVGGLGGDGANAGEHVEAGLDHGDHLVGDPAVVVLGRPGVG